MPDFKELGKMEMAGYVNDGLTLTEAFRKIMDAELLEVMEAGYREAFRELVKEGVGKHMGERERLSCLKGCRGNLVESLERLEGAETPKEKDGVQFDVDFDVECILGYEAALRKQDMVCHDCKAGFEGYGNSDICPHCGSELTWHNDCKHWVESEVIEGRVNVCEKFCQKNSARWVDLKCNVECSEYEAKEVIDDCTQIM